MVGESQEQLVGAGAGGASGSNKTPTLEEYGTNLTTQANEVVSRHSLRMFTAVFNATEIAFVMAACQCMCRHNNSVTLQQAVAQGFATSVTVGS